MGRGGGGESYILVNGHNFINSAQSILTCFIKWIAVVSTAERKLSLEIKKEQKSVFYFLLLCYNIEIVEYYNME